MQDDRDNEQTEPSSGPETGRNAWWEAVRSFARRRRRWILVGVALAVVVAIAVPVARVWLAWNRIERVDFDPNQARELIADQVLAAPETTTTTATTEVLVADQAPTTTTTTTAPEPPADVPFDGELDDADHTAILIIGSDAGGFRADVIMLALIPTCLLYTSDAADDSIRV